MQSQKISLPTLTMVIGNLEIPKGARGRSQKANILQGKYELNLDFLEGWGGDSHKQTLHKRHMDIFWNKLQ